MPVPLALAAPAAAGLFAYANARAQLWYDAFLVRCALTAAFRLFYSVKINRVNAFYLLESRALSPSTASKTLLWFEGRSWSYRQVYDNALRFAEWFRKDLGVGRGDIVAVDFQNGERFVWLWLGLWSIGARPAFLNYNLKGNPLSHCLKVSGAKICVIDPNVEIDEAVRREHTHINFIEYNDALETKILAMEPVRAPDDMRQNDDFFEMATLIYTSGTTGMPKPAIVSWAKCYVGGSMASQLLNRGADDIMYTSMPLYHSSALVLSFCATIMAGSTQAIGRKFSTKLFWEDVRESKATNIQYVGETLRYLLAAPPQIDPSTGRNLDREHHVKQAFGNGLGPDIWNKFKDRFGVETVVEFYAATEGPFGMWNVSRNDFTLGAMGRNGWLHDLIARRNLKLIKLDEETQVPSRDPTTGFCTICPRGEPGEMIFRLPLGEGELKKRFQGYHGDSKATESKIMRDVFAKGDIWFRSGDLARWDDEGRVFFHDRIGDTFRWKSENVSTAEVSQILGLHPAVREANVYGVQLPHHDGRAGCAAIFLDDGEASPSESTMRSLGEHVRKGLPRYAQPLFLRVTRGMGHEGGQTTGTNKQQKHALREAGVRPHGTRDGELGAIYWLHGDSYVPFREKDWDQLEGGRVKL